MAFVTEDELGFPVPVLAQIGRKDFEICVPFKYRRTPEEAWIVVPKDDASKRTDLASVPGFLLWLVPRYGVHTLAALLHDQLVKDPPGGDRRQADRVFRDALGELDVPLLRRWFMWAAVSLGTMWMAGRLGKVRLVAWFVLAAPAGALFWQHTLGKVLDWAPWQLLLWGRSRWLDLAIVAVAALLLFPRVGLGLLAGGALLLILPASIAVLATLAVYLVAEWVGRGVIAALGVVGPGEPTNNAVLMTRSSPAAAPGGCPDFQSGKEPSQSKG